VRVTFSLRPTRSDKPCASHHEASSTAAAGGGLNGYAEGASYTAWGKPEQVTLGAGTSEAFVTDTYDPRTGNLTDQCQRRLKIGLCRK